MAKNANNTPNETILPKKKRVHKYKKVLMTQKIVRRPNAKKYCLFCYCCSKQVNIGEYDSFHGSNPPRPLKNRLKQLPKIRFRGDIREIK